MQPSQDVKEGSRGATLSLPGAPLRAPPKRWVLSPQIDIRGAPPRSSRQLTWRAFLHASWRAFLQVTFLEFAQKKTGRTKNLCVENARQVGPEGLAYEENLYLACIFARQLACVFRTRFFGSVKFFGVDFCRPAGVHFCTPGCAFLHASWRAFLHAKLRLGCLGMCWRQGSSGGAGGVWERLSWALGKTSKQALLDIFIEVQAGAPILPQVS